MNAPTEYGCEILCTELQYENENEYFAYVKINYYKQDGVNVRLYTWRT
jgi:hypothetical protein